MLQPIACPLEALRALDQDPELCVVADSCPASLDCCRRHLAELRARIWLLARADLLAQAHSSRLSTPACDPPSPRVRLSLSELAEMLRVSPRQLDRLFHLSGLPSPMRELRRQRLLAITPEIKRSGQPLEVIAENLGYHDGATFSRAFKRAFGVSPGRLRARDQKAVRLAEQDDLQPERP